MINEPISSSMEENGVNLDNELKGADYTGLVRQAIAETERQKERTKVFKKLQDKKPSERWRLAVDWLFKTNPEAKMQHREILKEIAEAREQANNKFSSSKYFRHGMKIPSIVLDTILLVDPDLQLAMDKGTAQEKRAALHKLMKTFPEYKVAKVI